MSSKGFHHIKGFFFFLLILFVVTYPAQSQVQVRNTNDNYIPEKGTRPNILWLVTEDISPYLACYGDSTAATPNLDRLAKEGVRFTNVYSVSGVCAPSRSAIITGMYPTYLGTDNMRNTSAHPEMDLPKYSVVTPPEVKMFSELLRRNGYYCTNNPKEDYQFEAPKSGWDESNNKAHYKNRPSGKPFFSVFNFNVTHESQIWQKKNDPLLVDPAKVKLRPYYPESPVIRKDVARMYSNIMEMDQQVGNMLQELEASGLLEETIIVFYSDNGGPLPRGKREVYNEGLRVPMLIRFPHKQLAGKVNDELISFVDLAPTMLSLTGTQIPKYLQGRAFLGARKTAPPKYFFAARDRMDENVDRVRAVGDGRFKYIKNFHPEIPFMQNNSYRLRMDLMKELVKLHNEKKLNDVQELWFRKTKPVEELYDTQTDPFEFHNLAADPKFANKLNEMRQALSAWMKMTQDKGAIPEKQFLETMWPNFVQPVTNDPVFKRSGNKMTIDCSTAGSSISWQIVSEGMKPRANQWQLYVGPVVLEKGQRLYALAERIGYQSSSPKLYVEELAPNSTQ
jgi:N-sulfoglucosamine sulfohydrolase